jgi:hypothetical protein
LLNVALAARIDPFPKLACKHSVLVVRAKRCAQLGYTKFVGHDPILKKLSMWVHPKREEGEATVQ